jgi:hypothetical protein
MSDLTDGVNAYFYLSVLTLLMGGVGLIVRFAYKSKCKEVQCGCLKITRDIETEEREDMEDRNHPMPTSPSTQKFSL